MAGHPSQDCIELVDKLLQEIEPVLAPIQQRLRDHPGRPAETSLKALLGYVLLNSMASNRARLTDVCRVASALPDDVRAGWGDASPKVTYKRLVRLFGRAAKLLADPDALNGVYGGGASLDIFNLFATDALVAQVDASGIDVGGGVAFDGTVLRSPSLQDGDAQLGHYPSKEGETPFAHGYEAHAAITTRTRQDIDVPQVAVALAFQANHTGERVAIRDILINQKDRIDVAVFDAGYDFKGERSFEKLHHHGIAPIFDPKKNLRSGGSHNGKILRDGDAFCPQTPRHLLDLPLHPKGASKQDRDALTAKYDQRARYMMERVEHIEGRVRSLCPAQAGKIVCPQVETSLTLSPKKAPIEVVPPDDPPKCCTQKTTSTPERMLQRSRQGRYPYGTSAFMAQYGQRNRSESYFSQIKHNSGNIVAKGWTLLTGRTKVGLMFLVELLAENARAFERFRNKKTRNKKT